MSPVTYDIKKLISEYPDPAKLLFALWEIYQAIPRADLSFEETLIFDGWEFDSTLGNGICDLVENENYDIIARGMKVLQVLREPMLLSFLETIRCVFDKFGINSRTSEGLAHIEHMSPELKKNFLHELSQAESVYLNAIWKELLIIRELKAFLETHIARFEIRNHQ